MESKEHLNVCLFLEQPLTDYSPLILKLKSHRNEKQNENNVLDKKRVSKTVILFLNYHTEYNNSLNFQREMGDAPKTTAVLCINRQLSKN